MFEVWTISEPKLVPLRG